MRTRLIAAVAAALGLLAGCNGKCSKDGDCLTGQQCVAGVCQPPAEVGSSSSSGSGSGSSAGSSSTGSTGSTGSGSSSTGSSSSSSGSSSGSTGSGGTT